MPGDGDLGTEGAAAEARMERRDLASCRQRQAPVLHIGENEQVRPGHAQALQAESEACPGEHHTQESGSKARSTDPKPAKENARERNRQALELCACLHAKMTMQL